MNAFLTKATSTRVQIFLNPQLFEKFPRPHVAYSNRIHLFARIRWYPDSLWRNSAYTLCRHIGLLFVKKLDTILLRHRIRKYPDSPVHTLSDSFRIHFLPLGERRANSEISGFAAEFAGCLWTEAVSGKKKLRIHKYPDTCERGLNRV